MRQLFVLGEVERSFGDFGRSHRTAPRVESFIPAVDVQPVD